MRRADKKSAPARKIAGGFALKRFCLMAALTLAVLGLSVRPLVAQDEPAEATPTPAAGLRGSQQPEVTLIARVGFDLSGLVKRGCWARISVLMVNDRKPVNGYLRIAKRERGSLIYQQKIELPVPSRKLWTGYVLADDDPNQLMVEYYSDRGRLLGSEPVFYNARSPEDELVLGIVPELQRTGLRRLINLVSRDDDEARAAANPTQPRKAGRYLLFTEKALLPREEIGYQSISTVLWDGGDLGELDPERSVALRGWVFQGGTLIVAAGENGERVKQSSLSEILPVEIAAGRPYDVAEDFRGTFGSAPATSGPIIVTSARLLRGKVLVGTTERPLVVEGVYGVGRVVYVGFSLTSWALQRWSGRDAFLAMLFRPSRSQILPTMTAAGRQIVDGRLKSNLLGKLPSPLFIIAFLGLYIILVVPVNYLAFRALKRLEYAWLALPVTAIAFGFLAYNIGYFSQSQILEADEITLLEGMAGSSLATAKSFFAIYSPAQINEPIRFPDRPVFARPLLAVGYVGMRYGSQADPMATARNPLTVTYENGFDVDNFVVYTWAARALECDHVADLKGQIDARLTIQNGQISGTVTNRLGYPLRSAWLMTPALRTIHLRDLAPGQSVSLQGDTGRSDAQPFQTWMSEALNQGRRSSPQDSYGGYYGGPLPLFATSGARFGQSWFDGDYARLVPPDACLLLASASRSAIEPTVGEANSPRRLTRRGSTVVHMIVLPIDTGASRLTSLEAAFWTVEPEAGQGPSTPQPYDRRLYDYRPATNRPGEVFLLKPDKNVFVMRPRLSLTGRVLDSLKINFVLEKKRFGERTVRPLEADKYRLALYDFSRQEWQTFRSDKTIECPAGAVRFFDPVNKEVHLLIEVTDAEVKAEAARGSSAMLNCFLRDVAISATLK
jgi:hypothetical protein